MEPVERRRVIGPAPSRGPPRGSGNAPVPLAPVVAPTIADAAIVVATVQHGVHASLGERGPVAFANLAAARHEQGEDFGRQRIVGITIG